MVVFWKQSCAFQRRWNYFHEKFPWTTMKNLPCQLATEPNVYFANGDVDVFADNTQRTGKISRVKGHFTAVLSVATNVVFIESNPPTEFQSIY